MKYLKVVKFSDTLNLAILTCDEILAHKKFSDFMNLSTINQLAMHFTGLSCTKVSTK